MTQPIKRLVKSAGAFLLALCLLLPSLPSQAINVRLKDIIHVKGVRDNVLVGYGVVVGLQKTGDKSRSTQTASKNMLLNFGSIVQNTTDIKSDNAAAVLVTATVPPFAKVGDHIDVLVSSMADAKSLEGGVLIETQLLGPNGEVVAIAQGPVSTGGTSAEAAGSSKRTSITTSGRIPNGGIVERDIQTAIGDTNTVDLVLNHADYTLASSVAETVSQRIAPASALDGGTIRVNIPENYIDKRVPFLSAIENLQVSSNDDTAKVVINERTGTIVIGNNVHLQPAAIAQGGITVSIQADNAVSQPGSFGPAGSATVGVINATIDIEKKSGSLIALKSSSTLQDLVSALNTIGVTPSDLISILQALKAAGSLEAELEII